MTQIKAIIVEDEPLVARDLEKLIGQIDPTIEIIAFLDSLQSAITYFKANETPDLLFMDIQLSDGVSFDLLKHVDLTCPIIFTTAYHEHAIRAFKVNSIDYLLKPIDTNELRLSLEKFKKMSALPAGNLRDQVQLVMQHLAFPNRDKIYKERFIVHIGKSFSIVEHKDVAYFRKETLIYLVTLDKQQYLTDYETMEELEEILNPKSFFRANRQYLINVNSVENFRTDQYSKMLVQLKSTLNLTVDVSREKAQAFKKWIQ
jgi:two-component system, LytTR family, response regulator